LQNRLIRLKNIAFAFNDFSGPFEFLTYFLNAFILVIDDFILVLSEFECLLKFFVVGFLDSKDEVLHHDNLVALCIITKELK